MTNLTVQTWAAVLSALTAVIAVSINLYMFYYRQPKVEYTIVEHDQYPVKGLSSTENLSLSLHRKDTPGPVKLKYGTMVHIISTGKKAASSVQVRITAKGGAFIVQIHKDETNLVQRLPDIGQQGSKEILVDIPLMVPQEEVTLTFWYGIPNSPDMEPPAPDVLVRHSEGLGVIRFGL